jgi:4-carboxymuconolactone decarboxylase
VTDGPRIAPLTPEDAPDDARAFFAHMEAEGAAGLTKLNIVRTLAVHPGLATEYIDFGQHILRFSTLPRRVQFLTTLRTAWLYHCDYEWSAHARFARRGGMTAEEVDAVKLGADAGAWTDLDRAVLRAADELHADASITEETWRTLAEHLDTKQLLDLLFTIGHYAMFAMVLNAIRVDPEH